MAGVVKPRSKETPRAAERRIRPRNSLACGINVANEMPVFLPFGGISNLRVPRYDLAAERNGVPSCIATIAPSQSSPSNGMVSTTHKSIVAFDVDLEANTTAFPV